MKRLFIRTNKKTFGWMFRIRRIKFNVSKNLGVKENNLKLVYLTGRTKRYSSKV